MVDFLIVAWGENLILFLFLEGEQEGGQDLRFGEPGGELPLEVGAVLPQPGEEVGRGAGDRDGVVHQPVLVRQDLSEIQLTINVPVRPLVLVPQFNFVLSKLSLSV